MRYIIRIEIEADDPAGLTGALVMEAERFGHVRVAEMEPLEEQATMEGVLQAAAAARKQLEAAIRSGPVVVLDSENHDALHAGRDYETKGANDD